MHIKYKRIQYGQIFWLYVVEINVIYDLRERKLRAFPLGVP